MPHSAELERIAAQIRSRFETAEKARETCLGLHRELIRTSSLAIRAVHRHDDVQAQQLLEKAANLSRQMLLAVAEHPQLLHAGYVQDAQKEYAEAALTHALVKQTPLPGPGELGVEDAAWLNGLGEAVGELRRYLLDLLRRGEDGGPGATGALDAVVAPVSGETFSFGPLLDPTMSVEQLLDSMDLIYTLLTSMDYPDALTRGLRRTTDVTRGIVEKTRGDLTTFKMMQALERRLRSVSQP